VKGRGARDTCEVGRRRKVRWKVRVSYRYRMSVLSSGAPGDAQPAARGIHTLHEGVSVQFSSEHMCRI
jgi:putative component of toxin-antitoxin plasmid stabilization module